jgi:aspartate kinase
MGRIACKFGGTSLADAGQFRKVKDIVLSNPRRKIVVVSAPGKRANEAKITDMLYLCHETAIVNADFSATFEAIKKRFTDIQNELNIKNCVIEKHLEEFRKHLINKCSRDFAASRGEYFSGLLMAALLGAEFVDPQDHIIIDANGQVDPQTYKLLAERFQDENKLYVMPGFYGRDHSGKVKTFSRGGSDISGAIAARAASAELYENWTDVSGLLMADPRVVKNPCHMDQLTYREIRELSYMGASVFHDEAILPVREANIPINIKNTNKPEEPGTMIVPVFTHSKYKIAGIAGKKNFVMICLEKTLMNKEVGFAYRLLGVLQSHGISFEHCPSSIDTMSVILEDKQLDDKEEIVLEEIKRVLQPDKLEIVRDLALVAVVGEEMANTIGMAAKVFCALRDAKVNVRIINQGASELNIIVGVNADDYERACQSLYDAFLSDLVE